MTERAIVMAMADDYSRSDRRLEGRRQLGTSNVHAQHTRRQVAARLVGGAQTIPKSEAGLRVAILGGGAYRDPVFHSYASPTRSSTGFRSG